MELTDEMIRAFTVLETLITLEEGKPEEKVLRKIHSTFFTEISDAEYVVRVDGFDKQELKGMLKETVESILEETNQKDLTFKIMGPDEMDRFLYEQRN